MGKTEFGAQPGGGSSNRVEKTSQILWTGINEDIATSVYMVHYLSLTEIMFCMNLYQNSYPKIELIKTQPTASE